MKISNRNHLFRALPTPLFTETSFPSCYYSSSVSLSSFSTILLPRTDTWNDRIHARTASLIKEQYRHVESTDIVGLREWSSPLAPSLPVSCRCLVDMWAEVWQSNDRPSPPIRFYPRSVHRYYKICWFIFVVLAKPNPIRLKPYRGGSSCSYWSWQVASFIGRRDSCGKNAGEIRLDRVRISPEWDHAVKFGNR